MGVINGLCYDNKSAQFLVDGGVKLHGIVKKYRRTGEICNKSTQKTLTNFPKAFDLLLK